MHVARISSQKSGVIIIIMHAHYQNGGQQIMAQR